MNKIPLSLVALAAVGTPAVAEDVVKYDYNDLVKAIQTEIANVQNQVNPVKEQFLLDLNKLWADLDEATKNGTVTTVDLTPYSVRLAAIQDAVANAEKPYTVSAKLKAAYQTLLEEYNKAVEDIKLANDDFDYVTGFKLPQIQALKVEAILETVESYEKPFDGDPTKKIISSDILDEEANISNDIKSKSADIASYTKNLGEKNRNYNDNVDACRSIENALTVSYNEYNEALKTVTNTFPTAKPEFEIWLKLITNTNNDGELNRVHNSIQQVADNLVLLKKADYEVAVGGPYAAKDASIAALTKANNDIKVILTTYVEGENSLFEKYKAAVELINDQKSALAKLKAALDGAGIIADNQAAIDKIEVAIKAVDDQIALGLTKTDPTIFDVDDDVTSIENDINDLRRNTNDAVKNYNAKVSLLASIKVSEDAILAAVKVAQTPASSTDTYNAAEYFGGAYAEGATGTIGNIRTQIETKKAEVEAAYKAGTADKYNLDLSAIDLAIDAYKTNTAAALTTYRDVTGALVPIATEKSRIEKFVTDKNVSVSSIPNKTYGDVINELGAVVTNTNKQLSDAKKLEGTKHLAALNAITVNAPYTDAELAALTKDAYDVDKAAHDAKNAIDAAETMYHLMETRLSTATTGYETIVENAKVDLYGKDNAEIKSAAQDSLTAIVTLEASFQNEYAKIAVADEDDRSVVASAFNTYVAKNNAAVQALLDGLTSEDGLKAYADKRAQNYAAYNGLFAKLQVVKTDIDDAIAAVSPNETLPKDGNTDGQKHYLNTLNNNLKSLAGDDGTINGVGGYDATVQGYYNNNVAADKKSEMLAILDALDKLAKDTPGAYTTNTQMYELQCLLKPELEASQQRVYKRIQENDQSTKATEYLTELMQILNEDIPALGKKITDAFKDGKSYGENGAIETEFNRIKDAIDAIEVAQATGYEQAMIETNNSNDALFQTAYNRAKEMYVSAVDTLGMFSVITDPTLKEYVDKDLLTTHDEIYKHADLLRDLNTREKNAFAYYKSDDHLDELFDVDAFVKEANDYTAKLEKLIADYRTDVNTKAWNEYKDLLFGNDGTPDNPKLPGVVKTLSDAKADLASKGYSAEVQKSAYADFEGAVTEAKAAAGEGLPDEELKVKPLFAVTLDSHLTVLRKIAAKISAANEAAADAEWLVRKAEIEKVKADELTKLAQFSPNDRTVFKKDIDVVKKFLNEKVTNAINDAQTKVNNLTVGYHYADMRGDLSDIIDVMNDVIKYFKGTVHTPAGEVDKNLHTTKFANLSNKLYDDGKNLEAYNAIVNVLNAANETLADGADYVNALYAAHTEPSTTADELARIQGVLDKYKADAKAELVGGDCATVKAAAETYIKNHLASDIAGLKEIAVNEELAKLVLQTNAIEENYNEYVKRLGGNVDSDELAEFDKAISEIDNTLTDLTDKWSKKTIGNPAVANPNYHKPAAVYNDLLKLEAEMAEVNGELVAKYDDTAADNAVTTLENAYKTIDEKLVAYDEWAEEFEELGKKYGDDIQAVKDALDAVKADIKAKDAAGMILFYADNLKNDINDVAGELNGILNGGLTARHNVLVANKTAYNKLTKELSDLEEKLSDAMRRIKAYDSSYFEYDVLENGVMVPKDTREDGRLEIYKTITYVRKDLDTRYEKIQLTASSQLSDLTIGDAIDEFEKNTTLDYAKLYLTDIYNILCNNLYYLLYTKDYAPTTYRELTSRYDQCSDTYRKISSYNNGASRGYITSTIDGDKLYEDGKEVGSLLIDYMSEAWPNIKTAMEGLKADVNTLLNDADERYYIEGDATGDRRVNVLDWTITRGFVLDAWRVKDVLDKTDYGEAGAYAVLFATDRDYYTISDLVAVANAVYAEKKPSDNIIKSTPQARVLARVPVQSNDAISLAAVSEETSVFGKNIRLAVNLDNTVNYVGYQMDIKLPAGMTLVSENLTERANGHELASSDLNSGMHRVIAATIENSAFLNDGDAVLYLDVQVGSDYTGGDVEISNIIFSDAEGRMYRLNGVSTNAPTGIDSITAPTVSERIYSVGGQMMKAVKKGVNIIIGNDGSTKKVIKK